MKSDRTRKLEMAAEKMGYLTEEVNDIVGTAKQWPNEKAQTAVTNAIAELIADGNLVERPTKKANTKANTKAKANTADRTPNTTDADPSQTTNTNTCPCCGQPVVGKKAVFLTGHDGRVHGWFVAVVKGKKEITELPESLRSAYAAWATDQTITMKKAVGA